MNHRKLLRGHIFRYSNSQIYCLPKILVETDTEAPAGSRHSDEMNRPPRYHRDRSRFRPITLRKTTARRSRENYSSSRCSRSSRFRRAGNLEARKSASSTARTRRTPPLPGGEGRGPMFHVERALTASCVAEPDGPSARPSPRWWALREDRPRTRAPRDRRPRVARAPRGRVRSPRPRSFP